MAATRSEQRDGATWITLASPANRNALSAQLVAELLAHLQDAMADEAVRCIVLTGEGPAFCAGADLKNRGAGVATPAGGDSPFVAILKLLWDGPKPVIAAVNGPAFGGGVGLACACDVAIAVESARFSFSEVRIGLVPATISCVVVPKLGVHQTMRLFLTGERFDAAKAQAYGILHEVVDSQEALVAAAERVVGEIAKGGPVAIREAKRLVRSVSRLPQDEAFRHTEALITRMFGSEEAAEGQAAFAEKRPPAWVKQP